MSGAFGHWARLWGWRGAPLHPDPPFPTIRRCSYIADKSTRAGTPAGALDSASPKVALRIWPWHLPSVPRCWLAAPNRVPDINLRFTELSFSCSSAFLLDSRCVEGSLVPWLAAGGAEMLTTCAVRARLCLMGRGARPALVLLGRPWATERWVLVVCILPDGLQPMPKAGSRTCARRAEQASTEQGAIRRPGVTGSRVSVVLSVSFWGPLPRPGAVESCF